MQLKVGRTPRSAADVLVGSSGLEAAELVDKERVRGDPRGPGGATPQLRQDWQIWEN